MILFAFLKPPPKGEGLPGGDWTEYRSPLDSTERAMVLEGKMIDAIKAYRHRVPGASLIESKRLCELYRAIQEVERLLPK